MIGQVALLTQNVTQALNTYRFDEAASNLYQFIWGTYCDYYLEFLKPVFQEEKMAQEARRTAAWAFAQILKIAHPIIPFITEVLWKEFVEDGLLMSQAWPVFEETQVDAAAQEEMDWIVQVISDIRSRRAEFNVPSASLLPLLVYEATPEIEGRLKRHDAILRRLGRLESIEVSSSHPPIMKEAVQFIVGQTPIILPLGGSIDVGAEIKRLGQEMIKLSQEIDSCQKRLSNQDFMGKAKPEIIEEMQERLTDFEGRKEKIAQALGRLQG
jgi:valyl-tRNA synthetase